VQGADLLSSASTKIFYPDFLNNSPADPSWFAPSSPDGPANIKKFFESTASPPAAVAKISGFIAEVRETYGIEEWGIFGLCWGGKVVSLFVGSEGEGEGAKAVNAAAQAHPAMLDPSDALTITIPFLTIASGDEKEEDVLAFGGNLRGQKVVERWGEQRHGFMAARADLEDEAVREGYQRGYKLVSDFFGKYL
jgi:dienelactone hydrolase